MQAMLLQEYSQSKESLQSPKISWANMHFGTFKFFYGNTHYVFPKCVVLFINSFGKATLIAFYYFLFTNVFSVILYFMIFI